MNPKIHKLENTIEKTKLRISELQKKVGDMEDKKAELENEDYVTIVRSYNLTPDELADFLQTKTMKSASPVRQQKQEDSDHE